MPEIKTALEFQFFTFLSGGQRPAAFEPPDRLPVAGHPEFIARYHARQFYGYALH